MKNQSKVPNLTDECIIVFNYPNQLTGNIPATNKALEFWKKHNKTLIGVWRQIDRPRKYRFTGNDFKTFTESLYNQIGKTCNMTKGALLAEHEFGYLERKPYSNSKRVASYQGYTNSLISNEEMNKIFDEIIATDEDKILIQDFSINRPFYNSEEKKKSLIQKILKWLRKQF